MIGATSLLLLCFINLSASQMAAVRGRAYLFRAQNNNNAPFMLAGMVDFRQDSLNLVVNGSVRGLTPNGLHGFHVHTIGDIGNNCTAAAGHYNPFGRNHGAPALMFPTIRHVGDLGNIQADGAGVATISGTFRGVGLVGPFSIIGRTLIVHAMRDDLGLGNDQGSRTTGNAGARFACGIIGLLQVTNIVLKTLLTAMPNWLHNNW
ncbi:Extracellular superoxide dismutase [Cu-Zn] [Toxocara canis]|uniref:Superoxide dismutase [Cu-Zn] n=1 Tax=Toxocara canis TaxID=6265 RepID=A0A0B2VI69_TOXCA|nr:Extracellular superoxide dismutase [Cu-Zn] [Toxocara canis]